MAPLTGLPRDSAGRRCWRLCLAALLACGVAAPVAAQGPSEYQIKAVFLFNFAQFVEWPSNAFESPEQPISLCILGVDPFGGFLDETVRDEKVGTRSLAVHRYQRIEDLAGCHLLFVSRSEREHFPQVFASVEGRSILTVSDAEGFAGKGGMIRFVTRNNRINLRINLEATRAAGLTISSKLLRPAEIVATEEK
jgi:hypothetical protein